MASSPKRFTMEDARIATPVKVWKQKYCPDCWGKKINQHDELCKECRREAAKPPKPPDPYKISLEVLRAVKRGEMFRPQCECCHNQLSNDAIKLGLTKCVNCAALYGGI